jgi:hypothetical protein
MKKIVLAAVAALSLGIGSAYAHETVVKNGVTQWGPPTSGPSFGAGSNS